MIFLRSKTAVHMARAITVAALASVLVLVGNTPGTSQDIKKSIDEKQAELEKIKQKIDNHRAQSKQLKKDEQTLLKTLQRTEKEIDLSRQMLRNLEQQEEILVQHIDSLRGEIDEHEIVLDEQQRALARRLREMYMRDPNHRWDVILGSESIQDAVNRYKFMKLIAEHDAAIVSSYREREMRLKTETAALTESLSEVAMVRQAREVERDQLEHSKRERQQMLTQVRGKKSKHDKAIAQLKKSQEEVKDLIGTLEKRRLEQEAREVPGGGNFAELKGKMIWPVEGRVLRGFGKFKHPRYGTVTFNNGIDIEAKAGTPIRAVAGGTVEFVDWIEAYGKCIILNHGSGYYSLYAHVSATFVTQGQQIRLGEVIAEVGDTGSFEGYECHFEIRQSKKALDPIGWLTPRKESS